MLRIGLCVGIVFSFLWGNSQSFTQQIDSLKLLWERDTSPTIQVDYVNDISFTFRRIDPDSALFYAKKAVSLATGLSYKEGLAEGLRIWG